MFQVFADCKSILPSCPPPIIPSIFLLLKNDELHVQLPSLNDHEAQEYGLIHLYGKGEVTLCRPPKLETKNYLIQCLEEQIKYLIGENQ